MRVMRDLLPYEGFHKCAEPGRLFATGESCNALVSHAHGLRDYVVLGGVGGLSRMKTARGIAQVEMILRIKICSSSATAVRLWSAGPLRHGGCP